MVLVIGKKWNKKIIGDHFPQISSREGKFQPVLGFKKNVEEFFDTNAILVDFEGSFKIFVL